MADRILYEEWRRDGTTPKYVFAARKDDLLRHQNDPLYPLLFQKVPNPRRLELDLKETQQARAELQARADDYGLAALRPVIGAETYDNLINAGKPFVPAPAPYQFRPPDTTLPPPKPQRSTKYPPINTPPSYWAKKKAPVETKAVVNQDKLDLKPFIAQHDSTTQPLTPAAQHALMNVQEKLLSNQKAFAAPAMQAPAVQAPARSYPPPSSQPQNVPSSLWDLIVAIRNLPRNNQTGFPNRAKLRAERFREHFDSFTGFLRPSSALLQLRAHRDIYNENWWQYLLGPAGLVMSEGVTEVRSVATQVGHTAQNDQFSC